MEQDVAIQPIQCQFIAHWAGSLEFLLIAMVAAVVPLAQVAMTTGPRARRWSSGQILLHLCWVGGGTVGALLGTALPLDSLRGLDFALSALFIVLAIDAYRAWPDLRTAALALTCALATMLVLPAQMLLAAFAGFALLLLGRSRLARRGGRDEPVSQPDPESMHA